MSERSTIEATPAVGSKAIESGATCRYPVIGASWRVTLTGIALLAWTLGASAAVGATIETESSWNGVQAICCLGDGDISALGQLVQTFTLVPGGGDQLASVRLFFSRYAGSDGLDYRADIFLWGGGGSVPAGGPQGAALFSSGPRTVTLPSSGFQSDLIEFGNLPLALGTPYALVLTSLVDAEPGTARIAAVGTNPYAAGMDFYESSPGYWRDLGTFDLAFTLVSVPEPATAQALLGALAALAAVRRGRGTRVRRSR